jgi:hypothetical protein
MLPRIADAGQRIGRRAGEIHDEALRPQIAAELLAEQGLDVGLVIHH